MSDDIPAYLLYVYVFSDVTCCKTTWKFERIVKLLLNKDLSCGDCLLICRKIKVRLQN